MATISKPTPVSSEAIAREFGIAVASPNWRKAVAARRAESVLEAAYQAALAAWRLTPEGVQEAEADAACAAAIESRHARLRANGCGHLIGAKIKRSRKGGVTAEINGRVHYLTSRECEVVSRTPGFGND